MYMHTQIFSTSSSTYLGQTWTRRVTNGAALASRPLYQNSNPQLKFGHLYCTHTRHRPTRVKIIVCKQYTLRPARVSHTKYQQNASRMEHPL